MNITNYSNDEIALRCIAAQVAYEFKQLKRIGDAKWIPIWNYYVPQQTIVSDLWVHLANALKAIGDEYGICCADIQYETHRSMDLQYTVTLDEIDDIITTGIRIERITDREKLAIDKENETRCK